MLIGGQYKERNTIHYLWDYRIQRKGYLKNRSITSARISSQGLTDAYTVVHIITFT